MDETTTAQAVNPYLPSWEYVPDGEPRVFGDRLYVFGSHDRFNGRVYCMNDYVVWSAPLNDLSAWTSHGVTYRKTQDPSGDKKLRQLWAPDVTRGPDGRYYLFYSLSDTGVLSVAVSDEPGGQYEFIGHVSHRDGDPLAERSAQQVDEEDQWRDRQRGNRAS